MLKESDILYENGLFWVTAETFGKDKSPGFQVWESGITHSRLRVTVGWGGVEGLAKAQKHADRLAIEKPTLFS